MIKTLSIALCTLGFIFLVQATSIISPVQRIERPDGVHVVYYVQGTEQPRISITAGTIGGIASVQDRGQWRTTVAARLDQCRGVLQVDGVIVTQQRCVWLPVAAH